MFLFLSKLIPLLVYPLGLACLLLVAALVVKRQSRWLKISIGVAFGLLFLGGNSYVSTSLVRSLEWQYLPSAELPRADVILVLGGGTGAAEYPRQIVDLDSAGDRIFYASWLYHQGAAPRLLLTGGYLPWLENGEDSLAENMAFILGMLRVPETALLLEHEALNTYENAVNSKEILEREGIHQVVLVTSAIHMPRAVRVFEKLGINVIPAPTDYTVTQADWNQLWNPGLPDLLYNLLPNVGNLSATTTVIKEVLGIVVYSLRGWT